MKIPKLVKVEQALNNNVLIILNDIKENITCTQLNILNYQAQEMLK